MKIVIICVGTLKGGPEKQLLEAYRERISWPLEIKELVCRKTGSASQIKDWEGELLLQAIEGCSVVIGLDEKGHTVTSLEFANVLDTYRNEGQKTIAFIIGGAAGMSDAVRARCQRILSFGRVTWPHMLVRGMLVEQIYRAQQILIGHPYHRN